MNQQTAIYVGGPLDGQAAIRTGTRWSIYRDDVGRPIHAARGDREHIRRGNAGLPRRRFYSHQTDSTGRDVYIHLTVWEKWQTEQRADGRQTTPPGRQCEAFRHDLADQSNPGLAASDCQEWAQYRVVFDLSVWDVAPELGALLCSEHTGKLFTLPHGGIVSVEPFTPPQAPVTTPAAPPHLSDIRPLWQQ